MIIKYNCIKKHGITDCGAACLATICRQYGYPPIDYDIENINQDSSYLLKLQEIECDGAYYESLIDSSSKSNITASFSLSPGYGVRENPYDFADSFNFSTDENTIDYSFSIIYQLSSRNIGFKKISNKKTSEIKVQNSIKLKKVKKDIEITYSDLMSRYKLLQDRKKRVLMSISYANSLYEGENVKFDRGISTSYQLERAKLNLISKSKFLKDIEDDIFETYIQLVSTSGIDLYKLISKE